ncbi:hypothetical protein AS19_25920 [Alcanivorax sp. NBRC 101098]|uniref:FecR domain-containing protein n=1 Tax=Alcanivorax sp. NBRC 101098 TaxID=1113728 RepID=UPI0004ABD842|nr:FecR domain-containing protein [Alcanivorax sp. NBRC 101098]BAP15443.1 hypothetical protein AS19_25920 [Alcanivorax sp. NBRC 101098]
MRVWLSTAMLLCLLSTAWAGDDWHYTLRPGDSLWKVCQQFAQTPQTCWGKLARHNDLDDPHVLHPGDTLLVPTSWLKEKPIPATVDAITGEVMLYPASGGEPRRLSNGDVVGFGDALETAANSSARLRFADQSEVYIKPTSLLVVTRYRRFLNHQNERTELRLQRGNIRNRVSPRQSDEASFEVYTPGAVAAVRGTEYYLGVDGAETTRNEVIEGRVDVGARGTERQIEGGYATLAHVDEAPIEPVALLPAPAMEVTASHTGVVAAWHTQSEARSYLLELYSQPAGRLLNQDYLSSGHWQKELPVGDYRLLVRAVDENGLRGDESWHVFSMPAPPIEPEPVPEEEDAHWDVWVFMGAAALLLAL